jgi:hypothetical protein
MNGKGISMAVGWTDVPVKTEAEQKLELQILRDRLEVAYQQHARRERRLVILGRLGYAVLLAAACWVLLGAEGLGQLVDLNALSQQLSVLSGGE